jgi:hypothetical protein
LLKTEFCIKVFCKNIITIMSYSFPSGIVASNVYIRESTRPDPVPGGAFIYTNNLGHIVLQDTVGTDIDVTEKVATLGNHNILADLDVGDFHPQYIAKNGRNETGNVGQTLIGGTQASQNLTLQSTANSTRGIVDMVDPMRATSATITGALSCSTLTAPIITGNTTITGILNMNNKLITNVATPTAPDHAVNLGYLNGTFISNARTIGTTATGAVTVGNPAYQTTLSGSTVSLGTAQTFARVNINPAAAANSLVHIGELGVASSGVFINHNGAGYTNIGSGANTGKITIGSIDNQIIDIIDDILPGTVGDLTTLSKKDNIIK